MARLENNKWKIENIDGNNEIIVTPGAVKESIQIFKVTNSVIQVQGKVSSISINNSSGLGIVFTDVIASVEAVNSKKLKLQATGNINLIQLDGVHGTTIYLTNENKASVEIITSNVTEINVVTPGANPETDDPKEQPVPQQYVSKFVGDKLVTAPTEHVGV
eukprot:TRINITY_DN424_c0_g1_i1.p1 TRINITY_DN424_c0_g1~~TRINITY_DN424_c0_g1_i1.p1  ORF type:complete len:161 (+),score=103.90 TRINITY_DN424_c0_g1_i1:87-569(+)